MLEVLGSHVSRGSRVNNNRQQRENNAKHVIIPTACRSSDSPSYANVAISCYLSMDGTDCDIDESPRISAEDGIFSSCRSDGSVSSRHITRVCAPEPGGWLISKMPSAISNNDRKE